MRLIPFAAGFDTRDERERVVDLEQLYRSADELRRRNEGDWVTNISFLAGNQWESFTQDVLRYRRIPATPPQSKIKLTSHQILPLVRQAVATLNENLARQIATPATTDKSDIDAAELATDFLESRFYEDDEREKRLHEMLWTMTCGQVLRKNVYDPDADGQGPFGKMEGVGDISTETLNPWRYHVAPWVDSSGKIPWIIESDVRDVDEINDLFTGKDVQAEEYAYAMRMLDMLLSNVVEDKGGGKILFTIENTVEIEGEQKPALVAETLSMFFT
jgi:hypothetical protein